MTRRELREHCFKMLFSVDFYTAGEEAKAQIRTEYLENQKNEKTYMMDGISLEKEQPEKEN